MMIVAGIGIDALIGWLARREERTHPAKRVLGMRLEGGRLTGTFGFPYLRDWREIGAWFGALSPDKQPVVVTNEKFQMGSIS